MDNWVDENGNYGFDFEDDQIGENEVDEIDFPDCPNVEEIPPLRNARRPARRTLPKARCSVDKSASPPTVVADMLSSVLNAREAMNSEDVRFKFDYDNGLRTSPVLRVVNSQGIAVAAFDVMTVMYLESKFGSEYIYREFFDWVTENSSANLMFK